MKEAMRHREKQKVDAMVEAGRRRGREASFDERGYIHMEAVFQRLDGPKRTKQIGGLGGFSRSMRYTED
jgi:hypothetical protein